MQIVELELHNEELTRTNEALESKVESLNYQISLLTSESERLATEVKALYAKADKCCFWEGSYEDQFQDGNSLSVGDFCKQHKRPIL
ncbi:MAG: hypothetical protein ACREBU_23005 [Nitrososphaera sp.]